MTLPHKAADSVLLALYLCCTVITNVNIAHYEFIPAKRLTCYKHCIFSINVGYCGSSEEAHDSREDVTGGGEENTKRGGTAKRAWGRAGEVTESQETGQQGKGGTGWRQRRTGLGQ